MAAVWDQDGAHLRARQKQLRTRRKMERVNFKEHPVSDLPNPGAALALDAFLEVYKRSIRNQLNLGPDIYSQNHHNLEGSPSQDLTKCHCHRHRDSEPRVWRCLLLKSNADSKLSVSHGYYQDLCYLYLSK